MKVIYKYEIPIQDNFEIELPIDYHILTFQVQDNAPYIWVYHDTDDPKRKVSFSMIGTGNFMIHKILTYVGTVQLDGFVWHLFKSK